MAKKQLLARKRFISTIRNQNRTFCWLESGRQVARSCADYAAS